MTFTYYSYYTTTSEKTRGLGRQLAARVPGGKNEAKAGSDRDDKITPPQLQDRVNHISVEPEREKRHAATAVATVDRQHRRRQSTGAASSAAAAAVAAAAASHTELQRVSSKAGTICTDGYIVAMHLYLLVRAGA